ncbi:MAG: putative extracelllular protein [Rhodobacteraceae bacterium HLUCCA08]|nr:MAG: putative extracelllular protein [Rhodobacteraceae bacterium HLUCCA08]
MKLSQGLSAAAGLALLAGVAAADTIAFDFDTTLSYSGTFETTPFDLNNDGLDDVNLGFFTGGAAFISTLTSWNQPDTGPIGPGVPPGDILLVGAPYQATVSLTRFFREEDNDKRIKLFDEGETINAASSPNKGDFDYLYDGGNSFNPDQFPNVGDGGFVGFEIEIGEGNIATNDGEYFTGFTGTTELFYGFMNIQHGSIIVGMSGYNTTPGAGATVTGTTTGGPSPVPLPATGLMLLAGLGGLGALRRFRKG